MTTVYKPVLIETEEQAAALPIGTVAIEDPSPKDYCVSAKREDNVWVCMNCMKYSPTLTNKDMVGETALVPAEIPEAGE